MRLKRYIRLGDKGTDAKACKRALARAGYGLPYGNWFTITETFGAGSVIWAKQFQKAHKLAQTGVIDQSTFSVLSHKYFDSVCNNLYDSAGVFYVNPLSQASGLVLARTDQGVDYFANKNSPYGAIGVAKITRATTSSGWPGGGCVQFVLLEEHPKFPGLKGAEIYIAEFIVPKVREGDVVAAGQTIATFQFGPPLAPLFRGVETGYITPKTHEPCSTDTSGAATEYGIRFTRLLDGLGCPTQDHFGSGPNTPCDVWNSLP